MKPELITSRGELAGLAPEWDCLAQAERRDGFFRTPTWYRAWIDHIRPDAEPFVIAVRDAQGTLVGLAPLCRLTYHDLGFRLTAVAWAGREVVSGDFLDFLARPEARIEVTSAILAFLWSVRSQWSLLVMGEIVEGSDSDTALRNLGERHGLDLRRQEERLCPYIALPGSFDEYLNSLSSSTRYHIRRRIRDVIEKQGASVEVYSQPSDVLTHLDTLSRLHLARWRSEQLPGTLGRPGFAPFLRQLCANPPEGTSCRLYVLNYDGAPAAALLTFYSGESALYYQAGWDPDSAISQLSPGVVVMAYSIRDAIGHGMRYYEFLRGDEAYKARWTKTDRKTITLLFARGFMSRLYLRAARLKDAVKHHMAQRKHAQQPAPAAGAKSPDPAPAEEARIGTTHAS